MSKKYKVKTAAVFNGQPAGSIIEVDEDFAKKYEAKKYLEIIEEIKPKADEKGKSAPKKSAAKLKAKSTKE